mgnify:CR=1 FL=1
MMINTETCNSRVLDEASKVIDHEKRGLYDPRYEHDNCGIGSIVNIKGNKTHDTVSGALDIVEKLEHRAGKDAEGKTGDGVGILLQISHKFFKKAVKPLGFELGDERDYGIGMFFFPQDELKRNRAKKMFEVIIEKEGLELLGWRKVPTEPEILGHKALECMPYIMQAFVKRPEEVEKGLDFDRKLYIARRVFEQSNDDTYVVSFSSRTIVYKGMFLVGQLRLFFKDLQDPDYVSAIATVHSRFSTNTNPSWMRAHPNRFIVHNGEINTIVGNADKMLAREETMETSLLANDFHKVLPVVNPNGSDSARLDNTLEFLVMSGMELPLAVMITIPEPWEHDMSVSQKKRDFYQYYATMMEPWDGPASILFSDGDIMGAVLDRNGLRPSRYYITTDDQLILSSEVGVFDIPPEKIVKKDRLRPGRMLLVDTVKGELIDDEVLKEKYASRQPYGEWLNSNLVTLKELRIPNKKVVEFTDEERARLQKAFGYTYEEYREGICSMALNGTERIGAMGVDTPLAVLSKEYQPLFYYFKQLFAQVTNPPIDAVREKIVTSTTVYAGKNGNLLEEKPENCQVLKINNPILTDLDLLKIRTMKKPGFKVVCVPIIFYKSTPMDRVLEHLFVQVDKAYREGANILILSDRGIDENHVAIPSLLAVSAMQQHLIQTYSSQIVFMHRLDLNSVVNITDIPCVVVTDTLEKEELFKILECPGVKGLSGMYVSQREINCADFKEECSQKGIRMTSFESLMDFSEFKLNSDGLLPVVTQHYKTSEVLMVAYMNQEAFEKTVKTGRMTYFSRSRQSLWTKGETSGHFQYVKSLTIDCDKDTLLAKVDQVGAACHTGNPTCFFQPIVGDQYEEINTQQVFESVYHTIMDRKEHPKEGSYTNYLFEKGIDKILKKVGEEAAEIIIAAKNPNPEELKYEMCDFLYHMMVLMAERGITWNDIMEEMAKR